MAKHVTALLLACLLGSALGTGCRKAQPPDARDPATAKAVLGALYAGDLGHIGSILDPRLRESFGAVAKAGTAALLTTEFGPMESLQFVSTQKPNVLVLEGIWTVRARKQDYQAKIWFRGGKVTGIWLRPLANRDWAPLPMAGVEYSKGRVPTRWKASSDLRKEASLRYPGGKATPRPDRQSPESATREERRSAT